MGKSSWKEWYWIGTSEMIFQDVASKAVLGKIDLIQNCKMSNTCDKNELKAGIGLRTIMTVKSNKATNITAENAVLGTREFALFTGKDPVTGVKTFLHSEVLTVGSSNRASVSKTIASAGVADCYKLNAYEQDDIRITEGTTTPSANEFVKTGKDFTFGSTVKQGDKVRVYYYVTTKNTVTGVENDINTFGKQVQVTIKGIARDAKTGEEALATFIAYKAEMDDSFDFSMNNGAIPDPVTFNLAVLDPPVGNKSWELFPYTDEDIVIA